VRKTYVPDLASLASGFPAALPAPELLREFAEKLAGEERSSLGYFHLESAPLEAAYAGSDAATERLRERLGIFLVLPDRSRVALWEQAGRAPAVVLLGAGGVVKTLAENLEGFLLALARGETEVGNGAAEFAGVREELGAWLAAKGISRVSESVHTDEFAAWFDQVRREAAQEMQSRAPLMAAQLPADLVERVDPLLGRLVDDAEVIEFFESVGIDLAGLAGPNELREVVRPEEGVLFEIAWPWDLPSEWSEDEYPRAGRRELERRRARMFWAVRFFAAPESRSKIGQPGAHAFAPYTGPLPLGLRIEDDVSSIEAKLGPPIRGSMGSRLWDFPQLRRSLSVALNEGVFAKPERPLGSLNSLRWGYSQSR
jgi:hypothetical protein